MTTLLHIISESLRLKYTPHSIHTELAPNGQSLFLVGRHRRELSSVREKGVLLSLAAPPGLFAVADRVGGGARRARRCVARLASSNSGANRVRRCVGCVGATAWPRGGS